MNTEGPTLPCPCGAADPKRPAFLYLDEFQSFMNLPISPRDMLAKSRSLGLGMVLAHQDLGQLPHDLRSTILANARSKVVFQCAADDARVFAEEFGPQVSKHDLMNLGEFEAICRVATGGAVSGPITITTRRPQRSTGLADEIRAVSRERYGRPVAEVEAEIIARRQAPPPPRRSKLGEQGWG